MVESLNKMYDVLDEVAQNKDYIFHLPTAATKLDPVFTLSFNVDCLALEKSIFNIALNPDLIKEHTASDWVREYGFDEEGTCVFNHDNFGDFFLEGEIKINNSYSVKDERYCYLKLTYGKSDEAMHFIKGNFQLTECKF